METKLEVVRYLESDVIATSGHFSIEGMSTKSYLLRTKYERGHFCDWELTGSYGICDDEEEFGYFDENGNMINTNLDENGWRTSTGDGTASTDRWFHYVINDFETGDCSYILCNNANHRHKD